MTNISTNALVAIATLAAIVIVVNLIIALMHWSGL
jgi:hypothetical protein